MRQSGTLDGGWGYVRNPKESADRVEEFGQMSTVPSRNGSPGYYPSNKDKVRDAQTQAPSRGDHRGYSRLQPLKECKVREPPHGVEGVAAGTGGFTTPSRSSPPGHLKKGENQGTSSKCRGIGQSYSHSGDHRGYQAGAPIAATGVAFGQAGLPCNGKGHDRGGGAHPTRKKLPRGTHLRRKDRPQFLLWGYRPERPLPSPQEGKGGKESH